MAKVFSKVQLVRKAKKAKHIIYKRLLGDRRCQFYDLSKLEPERRVPSSPIIQFYSSIDNIGNYTPVLGIQDMLEQPTDTWCIQDKNIDFDFINKNYKYAIIGGAGLAVEDGTGKFEHFWKSFLDNCRLPTIIWGVGTDDVWKLSDSYKRTISEVFKRCDLVNVRDALTADTFNASNAHISACPTVVYLKRFLRERNRNLLESKQVTFVRYPYQVFKEEILGLIESVQDKSYSVKATTNFQYSFLGLEDIIREYYLPSKFVATTMLHASIISYGLGIPYISVAKTQKISAFQESFGNGLIVKTKQELDDLLVDEAISKLAMKPIETSAILEFGYQVKQWLSSY